MASVLDKLIAALAAKQFGYVTREQLLAIGLGSRAIDYRIATGRLIPVYRGVYAVGHVNITPLGRATAAVLACGEQAVLSHGSGATLWGFNKYWELPFEVIAPTMRRRKGIKVHRIRTLSEEDITWQLGVRVTTPERTVLDIAPRLTDKRLTRVVNDARRPGYLSFDAMADVLRRNPNHPGTKRLRRFVERPSNPTDSPLEDDFAEFAKRYGLPAPVTNTRLLGYQVDVLYPAERVIIEVDGKGFHSDPESFESDRDRDAHMLEGGFVTVRVTKKRMREAPERETRRLNKILEDRRRKAA